MLVFLPPWRQSSRFCVSSLRTCIDGLSKPGPAPFLVTCLNISGGWYCGMS